MKHMLVVSTVFGLLAATPAGAAPGDKATAQMKDRGGKTVGTIALIETPLGMLLTGDLTQLPPGPHGFHAHAVGRCEPPFTSAGGHFNPNNRKHGFHDAAGSHAGDLANLHASADGKAVVDTFAAGLTLSGGPRSLLDQDGTSLVIHAKIDDYKSDPAGDSGDRIICGVVVKAP
jgi:Cu-Zn family superoxide dismutase